jgi:hypothetical protein
MHRRHCAVLIVALFVFTASASAGNNANLVAPGQVAPISDTLPTITGIAMAGQTFLGSTGKWTGPSSNYAYQWVRCSSTGTACAAISLANAQTYLETAADVGSTLRLVVAASNKNGSAVTTSNPTLVVQSAKSPPPPTTTTSTSTSTTTTPTIITTPTTSTTSTSTSTTTTTIPTSTTTTTTTASSGSVRYGETWESGTFDTANWGHQCKDTVADGSIVRGTVTTSTSPTDAGSWSGRFDLPSSGSRQACEFLHSRSADPNSNDWFSLAFFLPAAQPANAIDQPYNTDNILAQFNYENINAYPLALESNSPYGSTSANVKLVVNAGLCSPSGTSPGCPYYSGSNCACFGYAPRNMPGPLYAIPPGQVTVGAWHQIVIHVYWTLGLDGVVEAWHRVKGGTWAKTVDRHGGFPTLQTGTNESGTTITSSNISSYRTVDKFGQYRPASNYSMRVFHDNFCRGTSFDAVAGCLG